MTRDVLFSVELALNILKLRPQNRILVSLRSSFELQKWWAGRSLARNGKKLKSYGAIS